MTSIVLWSHHQSVLMSCSLFVCEMKSVSAFCFPPLNSFVAAAAPRLLLLLDEAEHFLALPSVDSLTWKQTWRRFPSSSSDILVCVLQPEEAVLCDRSCWCHLLDFRTFSSETIIISCFLVSEPLDLFVAHFVWEDFLFCLTSTELYKVSFSRAPSEDKYNYILLYNYIYIFMIKSLHFSIVL